MGKYNKLKRPAYQAASNGIALFQRTLLDMVAGVEPFNLTARG